MRITKYRCDVCDKELKGSPMSHWANRVSNNYCVQAVVLTGRFIPGNVTVIARGKDTGQIGAELCWSCYQKAIDKFNTIVQKTEREE